MESKSQNISSLNPNTSPSHSSHPPPSPQIHIASFDIGKKNFSFYIEKCNTKALKKLSKSLKNNPLQNNNYNRNGTVTKEFSEILNKVYNNSEVVLHKNLDLTYNTDKSKKLDMKVLLNMNDELDFYSEIFKKCNYIIIEQQMAFGKKINLIAIKIAQHCASYFLMKHPHCKIIEFPSYHKTQILGAEKVLTKTKNGKDKYISLSKPKRKAWAVSLAKSIFENKGDIESLNRLKNKKSDDLADTFLQCQAFKYLYFVCGDMEQL